MNHKDFLAGILILGAASACGETTNRMSAEDLRRVRLPDVVLESATPMAPKGKNYLDVKGVVGQHIRFELLLPDDWNGRFVMGGGGGFVGSVQNGAADSVNHGYATVGTDTGHEGPFGISAAWAYTNVEAQLNFGYLAVHRTAEVAKALVRAYYGKDAAYSYFTGCSRGGGQAMMESQRYPEDFDGIVAGAPAFNWPGLAATGITIAQALYPDPAHLDTNVLNRDALETLQKSIIDQCDAEDGLKDGIIEDPASVHFDLAKVPDLTDAQRKAISIIYQGAHNERGAVFPGYSPGAEVDPNQFVAWVVGPAPSLAKDHQPDLMFAFSTQIFKYLVFNNPDWDYSTYNFSNFEKDTRLAASFLNATSPDLDNLRARHGKLIIWHGWADPALPAQATVDYYRQVEAHDPHAEDYCRLFMVPGCYHCGGGPGASEVDWLPIIADWVEHGKSPDRIIAAKRGKTGIILTRPLYPYPRTVVYKGSGDPNSADSFVLKSAAR